MTAVAILHRDAILEQLSQGKLLRQIAPQYGVSKQAIQQALKDDPGYQAALHDQSDSLVDHAMEETWAAREPVDIARAREMTKAAFRYAESMHNGKWGQRHQVTVELGPQLADKLRRAEERERAIDVTPTITTVE